jgi:adenine phosphoribosyltransferase
MDYRKIIREIPDYPKKGILFFDLTTWWKNAEAMNSAIEEIAARYKNKGITKVAGAESRGFIVGAPVAYLLGAGFVPVRKQGKLPGETVAKSYSLEYGEATIEVHKDAIVPGEKALFIDDLLATGGTAKAAIDLIRSLGAEVVSAAFMVELTFLPGRKTLGSMDVFSLVTFDSEEME